MATALAVLQQGDKALAIKGIPSDEGRKRFERQIRHNPIIRGGKVADEDAHRCLLLSGVQGDFAQNLGKVPLERWLGALGEFAKQAILERLKPRRVLTTDLFQGVTCTHPDSGVGMKHTFKQLA